MHAYYFIAKNVHRVSPNAQKNLVHILSMTYAHLESQVWVTSPVTNKAQ